MIVPKLRPSIRLLCVGAGIILLYVAILNYQAYHHVRDSLGLLLTAGWMLVLGLHGHEEDDGAPGSEHFHELADPARALSAEDVRQTVTEPLPPFAAREGAGRQP